MTVSAGPLAAPSEPATAPPAQPPTGVLGDGTTAAGRTRAWWRRSRFWLLIGALTVVISLLLALPLGGSSRRDLDPDSATPAGSKALAQILAGRGVQVRRAVNFGQARTLMRSDSTTLLVTNPELVSLGRLKQLRRFNTNLVLVEPNRTTLEVTAPDVSPAGVVPAQAAAPGCDDGVAAAGPALAGGHLYRVASGTLCYRQNAESGSWVSTFNGLQRVTVLGQAELLTNHRLADDGNAALAMRTLGQRPVLVWYLPDPLSDSLDDSTGGSGPSVSELLHEQAPWLDWVIVQLVLAMLVALAWRARRLGRLVTEPLPVVVRAAETQEGRARLYRRSKARGRAAATLRTAALRRIGRQLAVPADADPQQVLDLAALAAGWSAERIAWTINGEPPADDGALVRLAGELDDLERAVGRSRRPDAPG